MNVITNNNLKCTTALAALENVYDPEIGLNVVDLGLIYEIDFDDKRNLLLCRMTLTTEFCPMGESITNDVKETLRSTFKEYAVEVMLTFTPPWDHSRISEEGKTFLNR